MRGCIFEDKNKHRKTSQDNITRMEKHSRIPIWYIWYIPTQRWNHPSAPLSQPKITMWKKKGYVLSAEEKKNINDDMKT
jgi:hypothetical protein